MVTFTAELQLHGKTATGIEVPAEVVRSLGSGRKPAVRVTILGYAYRTTIGVMGGRFLIPVSTEHRQKAKVAAGDKLEVQLELDTEPRELAVPDDFLSALSHNGVAKSAFESMSYSNRRRLVLGIEDAKTPETRKRRIEKALNELNNSQSKK